MAQKMRERATKECKSEGHTWSCTVTQKNMMTESRHITAKFCKILQQMVSVTKKGRNEVNQSITM